MNNRDLVKCYVEGTKEEAESFTGSLYFTEEVLYSYGTHFPIALHKDGAFFINIERTSQTTTRHQGLLRQAIRKHHQGPVFELTLEEMKRIV